MTAIRQSTARTVLVGPILDADGQAKTDEVIGNIRMTKNGTVGSADGSTTLTHDHAGKYKLAMAIGDPDTVGVLEVSLNSGTNDMPVARFNVVEEAVYDALYTVDAVGPNVVVPDAAGVVATALGNVQTHGDMAWATATGFSTHDAADVVTALDDGATLTACITATGFAVPGSPMTLADAAITAAKIATDALAAAKIAADAANKIADHILRRLQSNVEASSNGDALDLGSLYGFIQQAQESSVVGSTLTVLRTDGETELGTKTLTSNADAEPITGVS